MNALVGESQPATQWIYDRVARRWLQIDSRGKSDLNRPVAVDGDAMHVAAVAGIVIEGVVHKAAVVP